MYVAVVVSVELLGQCALRLVSVAVYSVAERVFTIIFCRSCQNCCICIYRLSITMNTTNIINLTEVRVWCVQREREDTNTKDAKKKKDDTQRIGLVQRNRTTEASKSRCIRDKFFDQYAYKYFSKANETNIYFQIMFHLQIDRT